ncbi:hypothetical protein [Afifella aestuarii]|uniref:hypothetical protein n=1 Tax=Afifella aestuarii TaxID=1909496 RepID=UPI000FE3B7BF|nr:hypothetical protein [Afifella aestuarii]
MIYAKEMVEARSLIEAGIDPSTLFLNERAARAIVPCSCATLKKARCEGRLFGRAAPPYRKAGKFVWYNAAELQSWMDGAAGEPLRTTAEAAARVVKAQ